MTLADAVADEVQRRMTSAGMSQNALARAANMPATLLHRAMSRERDLRLDEVERLARALGVGPGMLLVSAVLNVPPSGDCSQMNSEPRQE